MAAAKYAEALRRVLVHEGGYVNHPADPGGETNKGVTFRVYNAYRQRKGLPQQSVRYISDAELQEIYRLQYWNQCRADDLPAGVDYVVFDGAVNSGPKQSIIWLQRALGMNNTDGVMGEATLALVNSNLDHDALIASICQRRMGFLRSLRTWGTFGTGWTHRVSNVQAVGQAWASGSVGPQPVATPNTNAKGMSKDISEPGPVQETVGPAVTVTSPLADPVANAANQLSMFSGINKWVGLIVIGLVILGLGITIYTIYQNRKAKKAREGDATAEVPVFAEIQPT